MTAAVTIAVGLVVLWFPAAFCLAVARTGRKGGIRDRRQVVDGLATALVGVLLAWLVLPWGPLPALLWAVPVALTAYGAIGAARSWPGLPAVTGRWPGLKLAGTAAGVAVVGLLAVVLVA